MPVYDLTIDSLGGKARERIEVIGTKMPGFTTIQRPNLTTIKWKYEHARDKRFYRKPGDEYQIHVIVGDSSAPIAGSRPKKSSNRINVSSTSYY